MWWTNFLFRDKKKGRKEIKKMIRMSETEN